MKKDNRNFPETLPLFPLPETVLFPGQLVPLHVFEPRYREMIENICEKGNYIGLALLKPGWDKDLLDNPPVHGIMGMGFLRESVVMEDGSLEILVSGESRVRVINIVKDFPYRVARVEVLKDDSESLLNEKTLRIQILDLLFELEKQGLVSKHLVESIEKSQLPPGGFADAVALAAGLSIREKQELLEALDVKQRIQFLTLALTRRLRMPFSPPDIPDTFH